MKKYFAYIKYVIRHKWFVLLECIKYGIIWRGIVHDLSKLLPSELIPYANYFRDDIKKGRDDTGYYQAGFTGNDPFDFAWLLHQKRNKHHWQWWVLPLDDGGFKMLEIPETYRKEMLCDWRGAGKAQGTPDTKKWYMTNKDKMMLGEETRKWLEKELL